MELAEQQTELLGLIKSRGRAPEKRDPYIRAVGESEQLDVLRDIVLWWRFFDLERYCPLTSSFLKRRGLFDDAVRTFCQGNLSPFVEKMGEAFLQAMSRHEDALVASVAQFELGLIKVKLGDPAEYTVEWHYDPRVILNQLVRKEPFDPESAKGSYRTIVSRRNPALIKVVAVRG